MAVTAVVGGSAMMAGIGLARMNARGMERAKVSNSVHGGVAVVQRWHMRGRMAIGPTSSSVHARHRPALRCRQWVSSAAPAWRSPASGGAWSFVAAQQQPSNKAFKGDLPNRVESQNQRGKSVLVRSIEGVRQAP